MPEICKKFHRQPIGRKIKRILNGSGFEESGVVTGMHSAVAPEWRSTYVVRWEPEGDEPFEEHLALKTIQSYYSSGDCYVNEEWVQDEIRILQSVRVAVALSLGWYFVPAHKKW